MKYLALLWYVGVLSEKTETDETRQCNFSSNKQLTFTKNPPLIKDTFKVPGVLKVNIVCNL